MFVFHTQNTPYLNLDKTCVEGQLYLVGGDDISRGRVQYCYEGVWYSLCGDEWSGEESRVVCQTLGYDTSIYGTIYNSKVCVGLNTFSHMQPQC